MSVFLSYAAADKPRIRKVLDHLKSRGIVGRHDAVIDASEMVVPGSSLRGQLRNAIANASQFVVVWSAAAGASASVNYDTGMAEALGKPIVVVVSKGEASGIPLNLQGAQVIELEEAS